MYIEQDATNYYDKFLMTMTMTMNRMQQRMAKRCITRRVIPQYFDMYNKFKIHFSRVTLIVPACQRGWEEMKNLRGNGEFEMK